MAASVVTTITTSLSGLGNDQTMNLEFSPAAPTKSIYGYRQHENVTTFTEHALYDDSTLTVTGIWIRAVDYPIDIDTSWVSSFNARITIPAGQAAYFVPIGVVYVQNHTTGQQPNYEFMIFG